MDTHREAPDFRLLFEEAPGLYLVLDPSLRIVAVSRNYLRATMTVREEILGRRIFEVFPDNPDDPSSGVRNLKASLERVLSSGAPDAMAVQRYDIRRPDSEGGGWAARYWSPLNTPVMDAPGHIAYVIHRVEDVTEFVGVKQSAVEQQNLSDELRSRVERAEQEVYARAQQVQEANRELRSLQEQLEQRVRERTAELTRSNLSLQHEIAERERTERALRDSETQLRQAQKLEAVGRLAGGVAHDFNNMLSVVLSYAEMVQNALPVGDPLRADVGEIRAAGDRAAGLTRQLLAFTRQQVLQPRPLDVNQVIDGLEPMLRRAVGESIGFSKVLRPGLGSVLADPGQLEQVLLNLVVNARDAMPNGGRITLETAERELNEADAQAQPGTTTGPHVVIAVSDTGVGMGPELQARIFEPFFTTKEAGKGTGLGLSTVYGIVRQSGGCVWVHSEPGRGAMFTVCLPRHSGAASPPEAKTSTGEVPRGSETILLVEDEPLVRKASLGILRSLGYRVLVAESGHAALQVAREHAGSIACLVTDVIMPGMSGRELDRRLRMARPHVRTLFVSGYTDDAIVRHGMLDPGVHFLHKPFTPSTLGRRVRAILDEDARHGEALAQFGAIRKPTG